MGLQLRRVVCARDSLRRAPTYHHSRMRASDAPRPRGAAFRTAADPPRRRAWKWSSF